MSATAGRASGEITGPVAGASAEGGARTRAVNFPLMDSIRAIALLCVVAAHSVYFVELSGGDAVTRVRFDFSVRVFFMISAFLLYRPFVRARLRDYARPSVKAFAWRRMLRILPAYWLALTAVAIWMGLPGVFTASGIPTYYGFAQIYFPETSIGGLPQAWSLCVEVVFYALLPLLAALMGWRPASDRRRRLRRELAFAAALFGLSLAYKVWIVGLGTLDRDELTVLQLNLLPFLDDFAIGMALASLSVWYEERQRLPGPLQLLDRFPSLAWLAALAALWVVSSQVGLSGRLGEPLEQEQYLERHYLFTIVAVSLLLPAIFGDPRHGLVRRLLANRALLYVGAISYGVYLYHFAVLVQMQEWGFAEVGLATTAYIWFPVALAGGVLLASVSYHAVEQPLLRLKRLVRDRPAPPAPAGPLELAGERGAPRAISVDDTSAERPAAGPAQRIH